MDHCVHKYTGLARKWNREVLTGVRVDPLKEVLQNFLGVSYLLRGSNPPVPRQIQPWLLLLQLSYASLAMRHPTVSITAD